MGCQRADAHRKDLAESGDNTGTQQNKRKWQELGQRLTVLAGALNQLPRSEMMRRPGTREFLDGLEDTLRKAYELVQSNQKQSSFSRFFTAQREARQLREVEEKIQYYLSLFPVISHTHLADEMSYLADELSWLKFYAIAVTAIGGILFVGVKVIRLLLPVNL